MATYPQNWPRCPACGAPALDGHITCGTAECREGEHRRQCADQYALHRRQADRVDGFDRDDTGPSED